MTSGQRLTGIDSILALDVLRKLAEDGVTVTLTYDKPRHIYRIDLKGGLWDPEKGEEAWAEGHTFGDAVETALDIFRRAWADAGPEPPEIREPKPHRNSPPNFDGEPVGRISELVPVRCVHEGCRSFASEKTRPYCFAHRPEVKL